MNADNIFLVLKYTGSIIAGLYGLYATLTSFYEEKEGKRIFSKKGYFGIALLTVSVMLSLLSDVTKDLKEKRENEDKTKKEISEKNERLTREENVIKRLGEQLQITQKISEELEIAEKRITNTSEIASEILRENIERAEDFELELFIGINPLIFSDQSGKKILSDDLVKIVERDSLGLGRTPVDAFDPIVAQLRENYDLVRKQVFKKWELYIQMGHRNTKGLDVRIRHQKDDGLASFVISHVSGEVSGILGVQCWIVYRISSNRAAGFRTFKDYNGAKIEIHLEADPEVLDLTTVRIHMGTGGNVNPFFLQKKEFAYEGNGAWGGNIQIPLDFF